jgi:hypothetical protein
MKDKKCMLRLLIEDVALTKGDIVHMDIRFVGGATRSLDLPLPKSCVVLCTTGAAVVEEIDSLIDTYTDKAIADCSVIIRRFSLATGDRNRVSVS